MVEKKYILTWDLNGIEAVIDLEKLEEEDVMNSLKGEKTSVIAETINKLRLRARFNSHRNYEIYALKTDPDINREDIMSYFDDNFEGMKALVREKGVNMYYG